MDGKKKRMAPAVIIVIGLAFMLTPAALAEDDWKFGIGTGMFALNIDGDTGFDTVLGPVDLETDLDTSEIQDLLDSAVGLGGFASKGKWLLRFSASQMKLEGSVSGMGPMTSPATATASFTAQGAEFAAHYRFALTGKHAWSVIGGVRYTSHEYDFLLSIDDMPPAAPTMLTRNIDQDWTDVVIGIAHATKLGEKWSWSTRLDVGFGGSEGSSVFNTGFGWQVGKSWLLNFYAQNNMVDFENDNRGDPDWYLYDANEFGVGVGVNYIF